MGDNISNERTKIKEQIFENNILYDNICSRLESLVLRMATITQSHIFIIRIVLFLELLLASGCLLYLRNEKLGGGETLTKFETLSQQLPETKKKKTWA